MSKAKILIADDDRVSLTLLTKLVEKLDYEVLTAADGLEAKAILSTGPIDLIISDYEMPHFDGLELLKHVKREFPTLPYILVTAFSNVKVIQEAWEVGAFDFFQKPVFVDRLHQTVRFAVDYGHLSIIRRKSPQFDDHTPDPEILNILVMRELAGALERFDLLKIVEEFQTHARIELEQMFRYSVTGQFKLVQALAHRLGGMSQNLGLVKLGADLRLIEIQPSAPINNTLELHRTLEKSIFWLNRALTEIFQHVA